jgi:hypothetical protein
MMSKEWDEDGDICPICLTPMKEMRIPCPDGRPGCAVYHSKVVCPYACSHEVIIKAYYNGKRKGITLFAWWKDGIQYVGTCGNTLADALKEIDDELNLKLKEIKP